MKKNNIIKTYHLVLITLVFLVTNSCKKDDSISNLLTGDLKFNPNLTYGTVSDVDGNTYKTITIGTQTWMAENLRTTHFRNGDEIETTVPEADISSQNNPSYQWAYEGKEKNTPIYGRLYTWYAVTDSRNICPTGWHVPTISEWTTLVNYLGGEEIAGGKLKETGISHWKGANGLIDVGQCVNTGATNSSGFTAVAGGSRWGLTVYAGEPRFTEIACNGYWWTKTDSYENDARSVIIDYDKESIRFWWTKHLHGLSVRCVKD